MDKSLFKKKFITLLSSTKIHWANALLVFAFRLCILVACVSCMPLYHITIKLFLGLKIINMNSFLVISTYYLTLVTTFSLWLWHPLREIFVRYFQFSNVFFDIGNFNQSNVFVFELNNELLIQTAWCVNTNCLNH